jgi:hypothetical protein
MIDESEVLRLVMLSLPRSGLGRNIYEENEMRLVMTQVG